MWPSGPFRDRETLAPAFNHLTPLNTAEIGGGRDHGTQRERVAVSN